ncbi:MAG: 3-dehydroquinate synthase II [Desulfobacterales bacterium]
MKAIWVRVDPWNHALATTAIEGGADALMLPPGYSTQAKSLGTVMTIAEDGDLVPGEDVVIRRIESAEDEADIARAAGSKRVILQCTDWTVIPIENLIARGADIILEVTDREAALTAFGILEKGVEGVLLQIEDPAELKKTLSLLTARPEFIDLSEAEITEIRSVGMGDRVCVDTCTSMGRGQGMLVGNSSGGLFLVHAESIDNPYVAPRPFRVNAGAVHAYTRVPDGKTRYLSELGAGDTVLVVDHQGNAATAVVGRLKIEKRPLLLVRATAQGREITTIVQNAETIRLTRPDGEPVSIVNLQPGDRVLAAIEGAGRHFGMRIEETITEK